VIRDAELHAQGSFGFRAEQVITIAPRTKTCFVFMLTSRRPFDGVQAICFARFLRLVGSEHQTLSSDTDQSRVAVLQRLDISDWWQSEESVVLSAELANALVTHFICSSRSVESVHQHSLTRGL
jgi:hypothetical protein